ncbi:MAG: periplasmic heavy metal sensor [Desulfobacteraceae bacterium]|nr:periplasmic heavy metal sensor [Desulfobacteraceae bacterium]
MKKTAVFLTTLLAISFMTTAAFAWGPGHGSGSYGLNPDRQGAWTDLSKAQQEELTALRQKFIDETYPMRTEIMQKTSETRMLMATSNPDKATLMRLADETAALEKQVQEKQIDFMLAAKKAAPELRFAMGNGQRFGNRYQNYGNANPGQSDNSQARHSGQRYHQ